VSGKHQANADAGRREERSRQQLAGCNPPEAWNGERQVMKFLILIACAAMVGLLTACDSGPKSGRGLHLPDGNIDQGKLAFLTLGCAECHTVAGVAFDRPAITGTNIVLGGTVLAVRTYGELVTSVVNPSHGLRKGQPANSVQMPNFNKRMTVEQMIDLVAFLQSHYEVEREPSDLERVK
jgi:L-cysteine S-thiosulfotransferase